MWIKNDPIPQSGPFTVRPRDDMIFGQPVEKAVVTATGSSGFRKHQLEDRSGFIFPETV
ncbi:MAG: hypothetical protein JXA41_10285 [Deltaproteobacteria bacterium]|nr:hypothetical protein [Deltaproteobacteria bacterium]